MIISSSEKFLKYAPTRDILFVFGAGASHPDGVPLQKDMLPMIISGKIDEIQNSPIGKIVIDFIKDNFAYNEQTNYYPRLEAIFGFIDYFIQQNESLSIKYTNEKIRDIKEYLIKLIHYVVNLRTNKQSHFYHLFWKSIQKRSTNSSIITLNYDTLLEQAFDFLFQNHGYIDYCIQLMNYERIPKLQSYNFWVNPREPVLTKPDENPIPYKIIKVHGSLNWKYCNCCNQTLLTPWDRTIDLNHGKFLGYTYPDNEAYEYRCPIDGTEFQTLILPPTYLKIIQHQIISQLLAEAAREIRAAKKIVFIGYSLSDADVHIKALFKKQMRPNMEIIVVNPKKKESMEMNYRSLSQNVKFVYLSFEEMLQDNTLMESLLAG